MQPYEVLDDILKTAFRAEGDASWIPTTRAGAGPALPVPKTYQPILQLWSGEVTVASE